MSENACAYRMFCPHHLLLGDKDYLAETTTFTFLPGFERVVGVTTIHDDKMLEGVEFYNLTLEIGLKGIYLGVTEGEPDEAKVYIEDNDGVYCMHYIDRDIGNTLNLIDTFIDLVICTSF